MMMTMMTNKGYGNETKKMRETKSPTDPMHIALILKEKESKNRSSINMHRCSEWATYAVAQDAQYILTSQSHISHGRCNNISSTLLKPIKYNVTSPYNIRVALNSDSDSRIILNSTRYMYFVLSHSEPFISVCWLDIVLLKSIYKQIKNVYILNLWVLLSSFIWRIEL